MTSPHLRSEQEVFDDLAALASTPGFAHVIAYLCLRDNFTWYREEMRAEDMQHLYSRSRLIRTEMSTLIGLMARTSFDLSSEPPPDAQTIVDRVDALMEELHRCLGSPPPGDLFAALEQGLVPANPWQNGSAMREPIFYGGEGAFSFQNCDFAVDKYAADDPWLLEHKGATIEDMVTFAKATADLQNRKVSAAVASGASTAGDARILESFTISADELAAITQLGESTMAVCIAAFALPAGHGNPTFMTLGDFNAVNGSPVLGTGDGHHVLFHFNALAEAVYESPFYWMWEDKPYRPTLSEHRGSFTEMFAVDSLTKVFGGARVYRGVNIDRSKTDRVGEIDVLVLFGDRAVVLQAKSKRLTLSARKGNDLQLRGDFKGAVQDAYDQAMDCAAALSDPTLSFTTPDGQKVEVPTDISQVYPICLVADHYPALAFQTEQFLVHREEPNVLAPLVIDVFTLDVMAEMLARPIRLFSYLELRALYGARIKIHHEITLLSYHLKQNLWLDDEFQFVILEDNLAADLEIAMGARRLGLPGKRTPEGVLTLIAGSRLDDIIASIEANPTGSMIDLILLTYQLDGKSMKELREGIDKIVVTAGWRGSSDFVLGFAGSGVAIHCNRLDEAAARAKLKEHVLSRKYRQRADSWFGLALSAVNGALRFGLKEAFPWKHDSRQERAANAMLKRPAPLRLQAPVKKRAERNDPCPCGSGKKYKKCHLPLDEGAAR